MLLRKLQIVGVVFGTCVVVSGCALPAWLGGKPQSTENGPVVPQTGRAGSASPDQVRAVAEQLNQQQYEGQQADPSAEEAYADRANPNAGDRLVRRSTLPPLNGAAENADPNRPSPEMLRKIYEAGQMAEMQSRNRQQPQESDAEAAAARIRAIQQQANEAGQLKQTPAQNVSHRKSSQAEPNQPARRTLSGDPVVSLPDTRVPNGKASHTGVDEYSPAEPRSLDQTVTAKSEPAKLSELETKPQKATAAPAVADKPKANLADKSTDEVIELAVQKVRGQLEQKSLSKEERIKRELELRWLLMAAGKTEEAIQAVKTLSNEENQFLVKQLYSLKVLGDTENATLASARAAAASRFARDAAQELSGISKLQLRNANFCTEVSGFGRYTRMESASFKPGSEVLIYVEIENVKALENSENAFETSLAGSYEIKSDLTKTTWNVELPTDKKVSQSLRSDNYIAYRIFMPAKIPAGKYALQLQIKDGKANKTAVTSLEFEVIPK